MQKKHRKKHSKLKISHKLLVNIEDEIFNVFNRRFRGVSRLFQEKLSLHSTRGRNRKPRLNVFDILRRMDYKKRFFVYLFIFYELSASLTVSAGTSVLEIGYDVLD